VVSRHQDTQQYGAILLIKLTTEDIRNTNAYQEYYACAIKEAAPKPKASAKKKKGGFASSTTPPTLIATPTPTTTVVAAPRLYAAAKVLLTLQMLNRQKPNNSRLYSEGADKRRTFLSNVVPVQMKELVLNKGFLMYHLMTQRKNFHRTLSMMKMESDDEEIREHEEESFDPIPRTPEESEDDDNNKEDQGLRISEEEKMNEEEEADELYRDVDINQGRGLQVSQETEDSHVILTLTQSDAQQESSSTSSFMNNLLNPTMDPGMESIFTTGSSTVTPIPSPQSTMTLSIISTFIITSQLPTPPTSIPSLNLQNLPTFASVFRFEERVKTLEVEAYDADKTILDTYGESAILKRRREDDDQEGPFAGSDQGSKRQREGREHASASTPSEPATGSAGRSTIGTQSQQLPASESAFAEEPVQTTGQMEEPSHSVFETGAEDQPIVQTSQHPEWFSQPNTPIDFSNFIMNRLSVDTLTPDLLAGPTYELMRGSYNSLIELEYHLEEVYKPTTDQLDWVNPEGQQYPHNLLQPLPLIPD
nr:hypothetical protein [Tanacetum cinerariifolium]